jgi:hypothetical protein
MPSTKEVFSPEGQGQAGLGLEAQNKGPQDGFARQMALFGNGQQRREEGDGSVQRRFRRQEGVVEVEDMPLMTVDQRRELDRQPVGVSPGLGFRLTPQSATVFQKDMGRRVIGSSEGDSDPIDDTAFAFVDDLRRKSPIRGFDEEPDEPVGHVGRRTGLHKGLSNDESAKRCWTISLMSL